MWSDVTTGSNNSSDKVNYLNLPTGVTVLRIIDDQPVSRWTHWVQAANHGKGMSVTCLGKGCPICKQIKADKEAKRTPKYGSSKSHAINVIDRATGNVAVLDKGNSVFNQMVDIMAQMPDIKGYDLSITKKGEKKDSSYTVIPKYPPTPLTAAELALKKYDITELVKPFTVDQVTKLMNGADLSEVLKTEDNENANVSPAPQTNTAQTATANAAANVDFASGSSPF